MEVFRGRYETKIDSKGRLSLPSAFRQTFNRCVITNGQYLGHRCLDLYDYHHWQVLEEKVARLSPLKLEVQSFQRFYLAGGQLVDVDGQGRVLLPQSLRRYADIDSQLVIVGMGEKMELWSLPTWQGLYHRLAENFESTLACISQLQESLV